MRRRNPFAIPQVGAFLAIALLSAWFCKCSRPDAELQGVQTDRLPKLFPEMDGTVIPPNLAPMNFRIDETGDAYSIRIAGGGSAAWQTRTGDPRIRIPLRKWRALLSQNRGGRIAILVMARNQDGTWSRFRSVTLRITDDPVDPFLVYRRIGPVYEYWNKLSLVQRNLENFDETAVLDNRDLGTACVNCHAFLNNDPERMMFHLRKGPGTGLMLVQGKTVRMINTKTAFNDHTSFPSWHPDGNRLAFSTNKFKQFFHALGENRDVIDIASDLVVYDIPINRITADPRIASPDWLETQPEWSADGKTLFFCRAAVPKPGPNAYNDYLSLKYDLMGIDFDPVTGAWGEIRTVLSSQKTGLSIAWPRASPDGRFLLLAMTEFGNFTTFRPTADLYLMDLRTGQVTKPDINSDRAESWHSWSSDGRWVVFSSKRVNGIVTLPFFSYVDKDGVMHKPFLLPQKDPSRYVTDVFNFHLPQLIKRPIPLKAYDFVKSAYDDENMLQAGLDPKLPVPKAKKEEPSVMWAPGVLPTN
jgi:dipeptidyl aminopeptidase/acylaminoacyl peptidase